MGTQTNKAPQRLTDEEFQGCLKHWPTAYATGQSEDPHQLFASLMGVTRNEAKRISWTYIYTNKKPWVMDHMAYERHRISVLSRELIKMHRANGVDMSVYQLLNWADDEVQKEKAARAERIAKQKEEAKNV
ncbi:hypothetical protein KASHIRA_00230 [Serratia phage vB_SmaM-Kashira]|nr:hypothetical protein [Acinetobacter phage ABPH49]URC22617.1 hypothetical protein KASHIRA_00230 [Serratia phage vB_SmaM-Kashira]